MRERERGFRVGRGGFTTATIARQRHGTGYKVVACSKRGHSVVETSKRRYQERKIQEEKKREKLTSFFWDEDTKSGDTPIYTRFGMMLSVRSAVTLALMLFVLAEYSEAMPAIDKDKERLLNNMNLVNDDGSIETALINYLFTKQIVKRLRNQLDIDGLQHKRSFWKQCATNAVACFGK